MSGRLYAGVAGFSYSTWRGSFYPADARAEDFLRLYAERLPAVELTGVFYRLPSEAQLARYVEQTPVQFRFGVKMTRDIVQGGRLERLAAFGERMRALGERLGAVRVQLAPTRPRDDGFVTLLLGSLEPSIRIALEAAHPSWAEPGVDAALAAAGAVRVNDLDADAPFRYLRLRDVPYEEADLAQLAERLRPQLEAGVDVFAFFLHEDEPRGAGCARRLLELTGADAGRSPSP